MKRFKALCLFLCLCLLVPAVCCAAHWGPAHSYEELLELAAQASPGDTLLISGELSASGAPLRADAPLFLKGEKNAVIRALFLQDANITLSALTLEDGVRVRGQSHVQFSRGVSIQGGVDFVGSGALLLDPGTVVTGHDGGVGVSVQHTGGDLYISLDGDVSGGAGSTGGAAVVVDPLLASGALMVTGRLTGGEGEIFGGNALNLHNLSGNAYLTIDGTLTGGSGDIGGAGLQLITAQDSVSAGLGGRIVGGAGKRYGGDAMMLMNVGGASIVTLFGSMTGGNSSAVNSTPGKSLTLVGKTTPMRTNVGSSILQDGRQVLSSIRITPLPEITSAAVGAIAYATPAPNEQTGGSGALPEAGD